MTKLTDDSPPALTEPEDGTDTAAELQKRFTTVGAVAEPSGSPCPAHTRL